MQKQVIRMQLVHIPVINIFTHDSINNEDGPTHQAVEQLSL